MILAQNMAIMTTINEGALGTEADAQNPSALPLPKTDGAAAAPESTSNAMGSYMNNQAQVPYLAPIPLPILNPNSKFDDSCTNKSFEVVSEDPSDGSFTGDHYRKGLDYDSDEGNEISR